tara:strand:+ start:351 stop:677 length:327 start_codon:yes stop_codon:yes gene_type:complete
MNNKNESDNLNVLRVIKNKPKITQREMANNLGLSLGKLNYVLKSLKNKGHIKINNFKNNKNKMNYLYLLTPSGIEKKTKLTLNFMKIKMQEFDDLKKDLKNEERKNKN